MLIRQATIRFLATMRQEEVRLNMVSRLSTLPAFLPSKSFRPKRYRPGNVGNWSGHLPFACDLVFAMRPALFVELGTHYGESYFGFCQALSEASIPCAAYAVDSWAGEAHAGFYGEDVYQEVLSYNEDNYGKFSYLLRSTFDEALEQFGDESIDILHIDGLHTYKAVSHDFRSWLPKVRPGGIVLLHDTMTRHADFGVWRLWKEISQGPGAFEFQHAWGLGVLEKPGDNKRRPKFLEALFGGGENLVEHLRSYYTLAASELEHRHHAIDGKIDDGATAVLEVFPPIEGGYSQETSSKIELRTDAGFQHVRLELLTGIGNGCLRIDPTDCPSVIDLRGIVIRSAVDRKALWTADGQAMEGVRVDGTLLRVASEGKNGANKFLSYGSDPQFYLPKFDPLEFDQPLILELWLRVSRSWAALVPLLHTYESAAAAASRQITTALESIEQLREGFANERASNSSERESSTSEIEALVQERTLLLAAADESKRTLCSLNEELKSAQLKGEEERLKRESEDMELRSELTQHLEALRKDIHDGLVIKNGSQVAFASALDAMKVELRQVRSERELGASHSLEALAEVRLNVEEQRQKMELAQMELRAELKEHFEVFRRELLGALEARRNEEEASRFHANSMRAELAALQSERELLLTEADRSETRLRLFHEAKEQFLEREKAHHEREKAHYESEEALKLLKADHLALKEECSAMRQDRQAVNVLQGTLDQVLSSKSWRVTAPMRNVMGLLRKSFGAKSSAQSASVSPD
jgi:Methyltransferase domain